MTEQLSTLTPNSTRATRVMAQCHERLAQQRRRLEARTSDRIERNLAAGCAFIYFAAVAARVMTLFAGH